MARETREAKARRLIADARVTVLTVVAEEQWEAIVTGDSGETYIVGRNPERRYCECMFGGERGCSHYIAAESAVAARLAPQAVTP